MMLPALGMNEATMGDVVNLNQYRKRRTRDRNAAHAAENRARFGRSKEQRQAERSEAERQRRDLDTKKLEDPAP